MLKTQLEIPRHTLEKIAKSAHVPAIAYSCVQPNDEGDGKFVSTQLACGEKNAESTDSDNNGVDVNTQFPASSLSKIVFTYLVIQWAQENKINLDVPLFNIIQEKMQLDKSLEDVLKYDRFMEKGKYPKEAKALTIRHILSHTSGLPNVGADPQSKLAFNSEPGEKYTYSGEAFLYLQKVIEAITGKNLEQLAKQYVFDDVGTEHSTFTPELLNTNNIVNVHTELGKPVNIYIGDPPVHAAGSMLTTAADFSKIMLAWLEKMNDPKNYPLMQQAFEPTNPKGYPTCGLGWHIYTNSNEEMIAYQYGCNTGTQSFVAINLNTQKCVAFFTNAHHGMSLANQILNSPDLLPIGDVQNLLKDLGKKLGFTQSDELGWKETFEGRLAEDQKEIKMAREYFEKAFELSPKNKFKRRLEWFNKVHPSKDNPSTFEKSPEQFKGIFTNKHNDMIEICIKNGRLIYKEFNAEIELVQTSENELIPAKNQSFKLSFDGNKMTIDYLEGLPKILTRSSPKDQKKTSSYADISSSFGHEADQKTLAKSSDTPETPLSGTKQSDADKPEIKEEEQKGHTSLVKVANSINIKK